MKTLIIIAIALALNSLGLPATRAAAANSEAFFIEQLASPNTEKVVKALGEIEKKFPDTKDALPKIRELLGDSRLDVKAKAARVLGVLHTPVDEKDLKNIGTLLDPKLETKWIIHGLKALRGLNSPEIVAMVTPLLTHAQPNVKRDACRTLAVVGKKDLVPKIEPLLSDPNPAVQKDARDAIFALNNKS